LILSAIKIPKPSPIAVRVSTSNGATGSSSEVFEMDIREDIAYHYTPRFKKEIGNFFGHRFAQISDIQNFYLICVSSVPICGLNLQQADA
jgi:hypothetical protein